MDYRNIYRAIYEFHRNYAPYPQTVEEWENATDEMERITKRFDLAPFVRDMVLSVYGEFERLYRDNQKRE